MIVIWILITLAVGSLSGILGKKYGVLYPVSLVSALAVMASIFANKIVVFGPFEVPAGVIVFSLMFFITDIISENWGKSITRKAVWAGFFSNLVFILSIYIVINWQPAPYAREISQMFSKILSLSPRIVLAGFIAYLVSQHHDVWAFHFLKKKTKGKHLWLRNNLSTVASQLIDSIIFITLAFYGVFPVLPLILGQWAVKIIIALIDTPFIYLTLYLMKKV